MTRADSPARLRRGAFGCIRLVTFRRSASDPASAGGRILGRSCSILALALAVDFTLPPLIRLACGETPSPEGEGFGVEFGRCRGEPTWSARACPRPTKGTSLLPKLLSHNEPGDPLRWRFTTRVADSPLTAAARRLASPFGRGAQCAHWAERVFRPPSRNEPGAPQRWWSTAKVSGSNCQRPLAAHPKK